MSRSDRDKSFLRDALDFCSQEARYHVADALACYFHNTGHTLAGNTEANDVEWLAARLYEDWISRRPGPPNYDRASQEHRIMFDDLARVCLRNLPRIQERIASRLIELSKILRDIERAERAAYKAKGGE